ncbi:MAG: hypothetical protein QNK89_01465 [Lacinutrix sp.]|uniref:hypothetical protein n=1 Tax=Lacinutrix sp. TaxID=1937692 RepID=UPI0030A77877
MKSIGALLLFVFLVFSCKKQNEEQLPYVETPVKTKLEYILPTETKDYSSLPMDTLIVSGKEIVFLMPSDLEFKLLKKEENIETRDSLFKYHSARVKSFLKFPEDIEISFSTKRIIGIDEGNRIRYYDKLEYFKSSYAMLLMYNRTFSFVNGEHTDEEYYSIIDEYYRSNIRFEIPIAQKYVISRNGLNIRQENGTVDGKYNNGDLVNIIGYTDDIIEVEDEGKIVKGRWAIIQWQVAGTTLKRYVFEGFLGDIEDVKVFEDQICTGFAFTESNMYETDNADLECLIKYLDLKLISKTDFNVLKIVKNNFLTNNPRVLVSENEDKTQNITLPIKDSTIVYKSKVGYSNSMHNYYGDINFLNQYLMHHVYPKAEDAFYSFVDRTTGKEIYSFADYPYVAPDKKSIISFV